MRIANSRLIAFDPTGVSFRWKDYRADGRDRQKVMTLATGEFIRRFLIHVLPHGFHRIRHYGLFASGTRADNIARARRLLDVPAAQPEAGDTNGAQTNEPLAHRVRAAAAAWHPGPRRKFDDLLYVTLMKRIIGCQNRFGLFALDLCKSCVEIARPARLYRNKPDSQ